MDPSLTAVPTTVVLTDEMITTRRPEDVPPTRLVMAPISDNDTPFSSPDAKYEEPLYTEIRIPLPALPKPKTKAALVKTRPKSHSTSFFRPFHHRGSSGDSTGKSGEEWPRIKKEVKSREVAAAMNLSSRHNRSGTVDALAVVPALLVLSAELFTPREGEKRKGGGKWEDGII